MRKEDEKMIDWGLIVGFGLGCFIGNLLISLFKKWIDKHSDELFIILGILIVLAVAFIIALTVLGQFPASWQQACNKTSSYYNQTLCEELSTATTNVVS
jgi:predicted MFS family arabinose efflux permease